MINDPQPEQPDEAGASLEGVPLSEVDSPAGADEKQASPAEISDAPSSEQPYAKDEPSPPAPASEPCPSCGADVAADALVCAKCGWDFARNEKITTQTGEVHVEKPEEQLERAALSRPGKLDWRTPLIVGVIALFLAAILAGGQSWGIAQSGKIGAWIVAFFNVLINGLIRTGLGLAALLFVARVLEAPFGKIGLAAARMALAVGLFYLAVVAAHGLHIHPGVAWVIGAGLGSAMYYVVIMWMFSLERDAALMVGGAHFILWLATKVALQLELALHASVGPSG